MDIYFVIWVCFVLPAVQGEFGNPCEVTPKAPYVELGAKIKVIFNKTCDTWKLDSHSKSFWTVENKRIDESLYETNATFSGLTISNIILPNQTVQFHSYVQEYEQIMGGTIIRTYQRPRNISCVTFFSQHDFVCHWKHEVQPTEKVNYKVIRQSYSGPSETCCSNQMSCSFKSLPILASQMNITVQAESMFWKINSSTLELDPWNTVQIDPPNNVLVVPLQTSLKVIWKRPGGKDFCNQVIRCQVRYAQHEMLMALSNGVLTATMTTAEVEQCTNYTTSVRCSLDKAPWSGWSRPVTVLSNLNVSGRQLNLWRAIQEGPEPRRVHLMWKGISPACNAIDGYKLTWMQQEMVLPSSEVSASINLDRQAHWVNLAAFRGNTTFPEHSAYVPAVGESPQQVTAARASAKGGVIYVSWAVPPGLPVNGYMIDWIADESNHNISYNWLKIQDPNCTLTGLLSFTLYNITVTPLYDDKTGRGEVLRICSGEGAPNYTISILESHQDKSAHIYWTTEAPLRRPCTGVIVNYTVFYKTRTQPEQSVTVNSRMRSVTLESLQSDTEYAVRVTASAVTGENVSRTHYFKTDKYGRTFVTKTAIICAISILVVLVTGSCCVIQWKRSMRKMIPNPGLSSLAFWSSQECHKPFNNPPQPETREKIHPCEVETIEDSVPGLTTTEDSVLGLTTTEDSVPGLTTTEAEDPEDGAETMGLRAYRRSSGFGSRSSSDSQSVEESIRLIPAPAVLPLPARLDGGPDRPESIPRGRSPSDPLGSPVPENGPVNPYMVQTPVDRPAGVHEEESGRSLLEETGYHCHTASSLAYVTLDMI